MISIIGIIPVKSSKGWILSFGTSWISSLQTTEDWLSIPDLSTDLTIYLFLPSSSWLSPPPTSPIPLEAKKHHPHLNDDPPAGLHGHRDEGDDGVGDGEVEHQIVHVRPAVQVLPGVGVAWGLWRCKLFLMRHCSTLQVPSQLLFKILFYSCSACHSILSTRLGK